MFRVGAVLASVCIAVGVHAYQDEDGLVFEPITVSTSDGVSVSGYVHEVPDARATVVLFHTTGSNFVGEFGGAVAERLVDSGFSVVGFDTRVGGDHPSGVNQTAKNNLGLLRNHVQAYADVEAGFEYARERFDGPMFVWGSGYAGVLAMKLSIEHPEDIDGVLGYSPVLNRRFADGLSAEDYVDDMAVACFLAWDTSEWIRPPARRFRERPFGEKYWLNLQPKGTHGSLMLDPARVRSGTKELWIQTLAFLNYYSAPEDEEFPFEFQIWGTMREAIGLGRSEGRVELATLETTPTTVGLGAMADLDGEVIVLNGEVHIGATNGTPSKATNRSPEDTDQATMLVLADVPAWHEVEIESSMTLEELEGYLRGLRDERGLSENAPMPFIVEGTLGGAVTHIMRGTCPTQIRGEEANHPGRPFREYLDQKPMTLVGFYAPHYAGILSHHGTTLHVHSLTGGENPLAAHVDEVVIPAGSRLRIPASE